MMAKYICGPRWGVQTFPAVAYNAGDVIVQNDLTFIADVDNPVGIGLAITQGNLYVGGIYQVAADAAYGNGTYCYWNPATQQVTSVAGTPGVVPFGWIVTGPAGLVSDGGPTGAAGPCFVLHEPDRRVEASNALTLFGSALLSAALATFRTEGNLAVGAGNPIAQNGADLTDDILWGCVLPASVLDVAFRQITIAFSGQTGGTANNKRFKLFVNPTMAGQVVTNGIISGGTVTAGTPICDSGTWTATNNNVAFQGGAQLTKYGAPGSNTQMTGMVFAILGATHGGAQPGQPLTLPENAPISIVITGSSYTTGAAGDVKLQSATVTGSN
ncbi:MAG: hypothetical protein JWO38_4883 [Gemmataceae bacterium]|nr:hypothetical protein [Gemmataceae bacterium]